MTQREDERSSSLPTTLLIRTLNEADAIGKVLASVPPDLLPCVLIVDGGSTDRTTQIAEERGVRWIRQEGTGLGKAIVTGIQAADTPTVCMMCGDGSYSGADIPRFLAKLDEGFDVVVASRYSDGPESASMFSRHRRSTSKDDTPIRAFGNRSLTYLAQKLVGLPVHDSLNGVKAFRREVYEGVSIEDVGDMYDLEMLLSAHQRGYRVTDLPIHEEPRLGGKSKVWAPYHGGLSLLLIVRYALRALFSKSHPRIVRARSESE